MKEFTFERFARASDAASAVAARPGAMFLAGGTTLVDLMKIDVLTPDTVVDVRYLGMSSIDVSDDAITIGASVTNSQLAWHPVVRDRFPVLNGGGNRQCGPSRHGHAVPFVANLY
ncbi:MAG TPA: FAD binding domain-containing protein [Pyrinomonadaceae bacterium]|nr:FAD binding domain-containing protein [Pyrinomonadaceae bacterium]